MKNKLTTVAGFFAALGPLLIVIDPSLKIIGGIIGAVGLAALGAVSKDFNVTGGNIPQASPPGVALKSDALGVIAAVNVMQGQGATDLPLETAKSAAEAVVAKPPEVAIVEAVCNTAPCLTGK